jgi:hypothetical protein
LGGFFRTFQNWGWGAKKKKKKKKKKNAMDSGRSAAAARVEGFSFLIVLFGLVWFGWWGVV